MQLFKDIRHNNFCHDTFTHKYLYSSNERNPSFVKNNEIFADEVVTVTTTYKDDLVFV